MVYREEATTTTTDPNAANAEAMAAMQEEQLAEMRRQGALGFLMQNYMGANRLSPMDYAPPPPRPNSSTTASNNYMNPVLMALNQYQQQTQQQQQPVQQTTVRPKTAAWQGGGY